MLLELGKHYKTIEGHKAVVLSLGILPEVSLDKFFCALIAVHRASGVSLMRCSLAGNVYGLIDKPFLIEVQPDWANFPMDTPVMYQNAKRLDWHRGHYAGAIMLENGGSVPTVWNDCKTSWAGVYRVQVRDCRLPTQSDIHNAGA